MYVVMPCTSALGTHMLGIHLKWLRGPVDHFEVYDDAPRGAADAGAALVADFGRLDARLEAILGPPRTRSIVPGQAERSSSWRGSGFEVLHSLFDRFGLEERLVVRRR